jgi:pimeloyl-ACP methyl ester carboxylesterase
MSPRASIRDVWVAYDEAGGASEDVVLFLHGFPHSRAFWAPQLAALPALAPGWRLVAPDLRGFGESDVVGPWHVDHWAADVAALLDHLDVERAVVVGLSMGGYVALAFWQYHAPRLRALVLADTRAGDDTPAVRERRHELIALARREGSEAVAESQLAGALGATSREERPELVEGLRALMAAAPVDGVVGALEAMLIRPDRMDLLGNIDVPTLVIGGTEDAITRAGEVRALAEGIPGARLGMIERAGHVSSWERPDAFNRLLADFLASLPPDRRDS